MISRLYDSWHSCNGLHIFGVKSNFLPCFLDCSSNVIILICLILMTTWKAAFTQMWLQFIDLLVIRVFKNPSCSRSSTWPCTITLFASLLLYSSCVVPKSDTFAPQFKNLFTNTWILLFLLGSLLQCPYKLVPQNILTVPHSSLCFKWHFIPVINRFVIIERILPKPQNVFAD